MTPIEPMDLAEVRAAARLRGDLSLPGDKSVSHRALILAALATGTSRVGGAGDGADVRSTASIIRALGATVDRLERDGRTVDYHVVSPGRRWAHGARRVRSTAATRARACGSSPGCSPGCR